MNPGQLPKTAKKIDQDTFAVEYPEAAAAARQYFFDVNLVVNLKGILFYVDGNDLWAFRKSYGSGMWDGYKYLNLGKRSDWRLQGWDDL